MRWSALFRLLTPCRHSWRYLHHTPECGKVFECRKCGAMLCTEAGHVYMPPRH